MRDAVDPVRRIKLAYLRRIEERIVQTSRMVQVTDENWADAVQQHNLDAAEYFCGALDRLADEMEVLYADKMQTCAELQRL